VLLEQEHHNLYKPIMGSWDASHSYRSILVSLL